MFTPTGNFTWTTPSTVPGTGTAAQGVTFTPDDTANYASASGTASVTVSQTALDVVLDTNSLSQTYDGTAKSVIVLLPTNLVVVVTYEGSTNAPTNAASYAVVATIVDVNYTGSTTNALVIGQSPQTIAFDPLPGVVYGDPPFTLTATASSGLPVGFASSDNTVASVSGRTVSIVAAGSVSITASQSGNANYLATNTSQSLTVSPVVAQLSIGTDLNDYYTVTNVKHVTTNEVNHTSADYYVTNSVNIYTNVALTITGNPGRAYNLQYLSDLTQTNWQMLTVISNLPSASYQVNDPATNPARFYRLQRPVWTPN